MPFQPGDVVQLTEKRTKLGCYGEYGQHQAIVKSSSKAFTYLKGPRNPVSSLSWYTDSLELVDDSADYELDIENKL